MDVLLFLKQNREGIIIGGIIGWLLGKYLLPSYVDFSIVMQSYGLIDVIKSGTQPAIELAKTKIVYASGILGALIGAIIDEAMPERRFFK